MYRDSEQSHDHAESGAAVLPVEVCPAENEAAWGKIYIHHQLFPLFPSQY